MTELVSNPYEGLDWNSVTLHKSEFHAHVRGLADEPADVVDMYTGNLQDDQGNTLADGEEYTIFPVADKGDQYMAFPWTEFDQLDSTFENRDPEQLGVVSLPGAELNLGSEYEHLSSIFSTAMESDVTSQTDRYTAVESHVQLDESFDEPDSMVVIAHPEDYYDDPETDWTRYVDDFTDFSLDDGLLGFEVFHYQFDYSYDFQNQMPDVTMWDNMLTEFMPDRQIWGFSVDDPGHQTDGWTVGERVDRRITYVAMEDSEFDPSDQVGSRQRAADAYKSGKTFAAIRSEWDPDVEQPPTVPTVNSINVDEDNTEIAIDASDFDTIKWIVDGSEDATGSTYNYGDTQGNYVRAELWGSGDDSVLLTQPFGLNTVLPMLEDEYTHYGRARTGKKSPGDDNEVTVAGSDWNDIVEEENVEIGAGKISLVPPDFPSDVEHFYEYEDDSDTTVAVDTEGDNNLDISGATYTTTAKVGELAMDHGVDEYTQSQSTVDLVTQGDEEELEISAWVYFPDGVDLTSRHGIVSYSPESSGTLSENLTIEHRDDSNGIRAYLQIADENYIVTSNWVPNTGEWNHFSAYATQSEVGLIINNDQTFTESNGGDLTNLPASYLWSGTRNNEFDDGEVIVDEFATAISKLTDEDRTHLYER